MNLSEVMTKEEQQAIKELIAAYLNEQIARLNLSKAVEDKKKAARNVTNLWWRTNEKDEPVGTIPESFVVEYQGSLYLIRIDPDGDNAHTVSLVSGILS